MNNLQLELKNILPYLPYHLKFQYFDNFNEAPNNSHIQELINLSGRESNGYQCVNEGCYLTFNIKEIKPLLIPMSYLDKKILHNGKTIIPIVELAKVAFWVEYKKGFITDKFANKNEFNNDQSIWLYGAQWHVGKGSSVAPDEMATLILYPARGKGSVHFQHRQYVHGREHTHPVHCMLELFQKMAELQLDFMGLIDAGLAINKLNHIK